MVLLTLREMAKGGMHDQLGGGFHRYSVDERWFVPHFEKMLYDQAQLAISYLEAFQITGDPQYAETARRILDYVLRDMTGPKAASIPPRTPTAPSIPPSRDDEERGRVLHLERRGDPRVAGRARGRLVLLTATACGGRQRGARPARRIHRPQHSLPGAYHGRDTARHFGRPAEEVRAALGRSRAQLLEARAKRPRPHLDDKILTAWNGLMISAFALGGAVLEEPRYAEAARRAAEFLIDPHVRPGDAASCCAAIAQGDAAIPGFLDDYALFAQGLLDLYEAQFDLRHLELAAARSPKSSASCSKTPATAPFSAPPPAMPAW